MRKEIAAILADFDTAHGAELEALCDAAGKLVSKIMDSVELDKHSPIEETRILAEYRKTCAQHIGSMIGAVQSAAFSAAFALHDNRQAKQDRVVRELRRNAGNVKTRPVMVDTID